MKPAFWIVLIGVAVAMVAIVQSWIGANDQRPDSFQAVLAVAALAATLVAREATR